MIYVGTFFLTALIGRFGCMSRYSFVRIPTAIIFLVGIFGSAIMIMKELIFRV
jgi:Na+(H+)/acetate symporter ActP